MPAGSGSGSGCGSGSGSGRVVSSLVFSKYSVPPLIAQAIMPSSSSVSVRAGSLSVNSAPSAKLKRSMASLIIRTSPPRISMSSESMPKKSCMESANISIGMLMP